MVRVTKSMPCQKDQMGKLFNPASLGAIAETKPNKYTKLFSEGIRVALRLAPFGVSVSIGYDPMTFNHAHLQNLGLIEREDGKWRLSVFGEGFIRAVTDPSLAGGQAAEPGAAPVRGRHAGFSGV